MKIDCDSCSLKNISCDDCVMTVLLQILPINESRQTSPAITDGDAQIFSVLAEAGMVPTLKYRAR